MKFPQKRLFLPLILAAFAASAMERNFLSSGLTPIMALLVLYPEERAVPLAAESVTELFAEKVWASPAAGICCMTSLSGAPCAWSEANACAPCPMPSPMMKMMLRGVPSWGKVASAFASTGAGAG